LLAFDSGVIVLRLRSFSSEEHWKSYASFFELGLLSCELLSFVTEIVVVVVAVVVVVVVVANV